MSRSMRCTAPALLSPFWALIPACTQDVATSGFAPCSPCGGRSGFGPSAGYSNQPCLCKAPPRLVLLRAAADLWCRVNPTLVGRDHAGRASAWTQYDADTGVQKTRQEETATASTPGTSVLTLHRTISMNAGSGLLQPRNTSCRTDEG